MESFNQVNLIQRQIDHLEQDCQEEIQKAPSQPKGVDKNISNSFDAIRESLQMTKTLIQERACNPLNDRFKTATGEYFDCLEELTGLSNRLEQLFQERQKKILMPFLNASSDETVPTSAVQSLTLSPSSESSSRRSMEKDVSESRNDRIMKQPGDSQGMRHHLDARIDCKKPYVSPIKTWSREDQLKQDRLAERRLQYPSFREILRDGNAFFSGFTVLFLEHLVQTKQTATFLQCLLDKNFGEDPSLYTEISNALLELQESPRMLANRLEDNTKIFPFLKLFRLVAADHMSKHPDYFNPFSTESQSFEDYIKDQVLEMRISPNDQTILALCNALDCAITIHDTYQKPRRIGDKNKPALGTLGYHNEQQYLVLYSHSL